MKNQVTLSNGITYNIDAELKVEEGTPLSKRCISTLALVRPQGKKKFYAIRDLNNKVTILSEMFF